MAQLSADLAFAQVELGGTEPAGATVTVRIDGDGFHDPGGLGAAGQPVEPISVERVAARLREEFDAAALHEILGHLAALCESLST